MKDCNQEWKGELLSVARPEKVEIFYSFFKTGKGEYGEGDIFIGVTVPDNRKIAHRYFEKTLEEIGEMLSQDIHEYRLSGLLALVHKFDKEKDLAKRQEIVDFYVANAEKCNNWDLVDLSAPYILGRHLLSYPNALLLDDLSKSDNLWRQRIAIVATMMLIRHNKYDDTMRIAERYLSHPHQLIHKATGWMLREVGKRDEQQLLHFLDNHCAKMPRTALRYAIERLSEEKRKFYMFVSKNSK